MKRKYVKPIILRVLLDNSITLQMASQPHNLPPEDIGKKGNSTPFQSPFGDKPFG
jgi:hypothetical protein